MCCVQGAYHQFNVQSDGEDMEEREGMVPGEDEEEGHTHAEAEEVSHSCHM